MIQSLKITGQLIAVTVTGTADQHDWRKVADAVNDALEKHDDVAVFADLTHLDTITAGAMYEDAKVGIQNLGNLDRFNRIAVVTEKEWLQRTLELSEKLLPGVAVQVFASDEAESAHRWAADS